MNEICSLIPVFDHGKKRNATAFALIDLFFFFFSPGFVQAEAALTKNAIVVGL